MSDYDSDYDSKYGYNRNAFAYKTVGTAIISRVVKVIMTLIGLVSEAIYARRDRRRSSIALEDKKTTEGQVKRKESAYVKVPLEVADTADRETPTHELVVEEGVGCDEADWALDEAATEGGDKEVTSSNEKKSENPKERADSKATKSSNQKLPFPVILPQRRPGIKTRGFVRAYPPVLKESGISQHTFLRFLKDFHKAAQASPIFDVVMIANAIAAAYSDPVIDLGI